MIRPVKTFFSKVTDEYGGEYPEAIVAVRAFSESSQTTGNSSNCQDDYVIDSELEAITYKVNYWYSEKTKADGKRSRPLINDDNGNFTDVFTVDLENPDVINILDSEADHFDKVLAAIKVDAKRKFS
tara:strand:- start:3358 stop:3738 length:381 start_codon:yes stop_codon:yes gene_type:complete